MKKSYSVFWSVLVVLLVLVSVGCTSTKFYYYETDATTPADERCIIGLVDNEGGVLNVVSIDGKRADLGGSYTANKSFMMKSGNRSIVMDWVSNVGNFKGVLAPGIKVEGDFMPGKVYLFVPRAERVEGPGRWEVLAPGLRFYNTTAYKIYIEIYDVAHLEEYEISNMDKNHFAKIHQSILEAQNKQ